MSIQNPTQRDLEAAYYAGLRGFEGDPEVAEDLGIPTSPDSFKRHLTAAAETKQATVFSREEATAKLSVFCGDCLIEIEPGDSCGHISVPTDGKPKIQG